MAATGKASASAGATMWSSTEPAISMRPRSTLLTSTNPPPADSLSEGSSRPEIGSHGSTTPNRRMNISPQRKSGMACTMAANPSMTVDNQRPCQAADNTPAKPPSRQASNIATKPSSSVAGSRCATRLTTSCRKVIELPSLPCASSRSQITNCSAIDVSRP